MSPVLSDALFVEQRTYTLFPGKLPEYLRLYETEGFPVQVPVLGNLVGYYAVEVGPLNTVIHQWAFDSSADRDARRSDLLALPAWRTYWAKVQPLVVSQESRFLKPAPFFRDRLRNMLASASGVSDN